MTDDQFEILANSMWARMERYESVTMTEQIQVGERVLWRGYFEHGSEPLIGRVAGIYRHGADEATATVAFGVRSLFYRDIPLGELERIEESQETP